MYCERWESSTIHTQALHIHQGLDNFKQRITRQNDAKNRNLAKTKSIDSVTSLDLKQLSVLMKYRYIAIRWMIMINMSYRVKKLVCDSQINDSRCQLQSLCIPTLSQPLTRRTNTSLSCYHVWPRLVSLPSILNCKCSMNHTRKRVTFILSWTFWFDYKRVWKDTCSMSCHWSARPRSKMTISAQSIVHSVARVLRGKYGKWDIMHMWLVSTQMVLRWSITRLDNTFVLVARSAIYNSHSTRRSIDCQCISTMDLIMTSHSSWNSSHWWERRKDLWKSFQLSRARKCRSNTMVFNSKTHWNWSVVLSRPSWLRHSRMTWNSTNIPRLNSKSTRSLVTRSGLTSISICWHGRNSYSILSSNHTIPWTTQSYHL